MIARELPDFVADIELLPTEAGGRKGPLMGGEWRTVLGVNGEHWSALLRFDRGQVPGAIFDAAVWLLMFDVALPMFEEGKVFEVWEGGTKGWGCVKRRPGRAA